MCFSWHFLCSASQSAFFHQHGCTTNDTNAKYNSRVAQLYKEKIKSLATQATRRHGTDVSSVCPVPIRFLKIFIFSPWSNFKFPISNAKDYLSLGGTDTHCSE